MKLSTCSILALVAHSAVAFAPSAVSGPVSTSSSAPSSYSSITSSSSTSTTSSALHLFGGGGNKGGGEKKGGPGGMMEQMAMLKKAQEVASQKKKIDEDLSKRTFEAESSNGKVKAVFKYVPVSSPMDPNPDYEATAFTFDDEFFASATAEELSEACKETVFNGMNVVNMAIAEAFQPLNEAIASIMGGGAAPQE